MSKSQKPISPAVTSASSSLPPLADALRADFDATRAERVTIDPTTRSTFDLTGGYVLVSGALPSLRLLHERFEKALPEFDVSLLRKVDVYGRAALYAQSVERSTTNTGAAHHAHMVEEVETLYSRFYRNAEFLVAEGLFDAKVVTNARTGTSVRDRATDLRVLAVEFASKESSLAGRTLITRANIEHAFALSQSILDSLATRDAASEAQLIAQRDRQQAAALFARAWNEIRRAVTWLRWHEGDADRLAPSLYSLNNRRSTDSNRERSEPPPPAKPDGPADPSKPEPPTNDPAAR
jgi:hypothetical protein